MSNSNKVNKRNGIQEELSIDKINDFLKILSRIDPPCGKIDIGKINSKRWLRNH